MATFLFVLWEGGGNVNPFLGLAEGLVARGHRVEAVATASLSDRLVDSGVERVVPASGWIPTATDVMKAVSSSVPPAAVVVDYMAPSALNGSLVLGLPTVALVHTLFVDLLDGGAPAPMSMAASLEVLNEERTQLGVAPALCMGDLLGECKLVLVTAERELDGPGDVAPNVRYVGALFQGPGPDADWTPPAGDGPLVVASMGTAGQGEAPVLQRVLDALAGMRVRGLVTVPSYVPRADLSVPENVSVTGYVRHSAVLPHADLMLTHAGLGSITAALAFGVPMVCIPEDREQPANADAVARLGAGQVVARDASPALIREAIGRALAGPRPSPAPPGPEAVDLLEGLAGGVA